MRRHGSRRSVASSTGPMMHKPKILLGEQLARRAPARRPRSPRRCAASISSGVTWRPSANSLRPEPNHAARRRLEREREVALDVFLGELNSSSPIGVVAHARELLDDHVDARLDIVGRSTGIDAEEPGAAICGLKRIDAVDEAALLANLLEEPARHSAAQDRIEQRKRVAPLVANVDAARADHDVSLFAILVANVRRGRRQRAFGPVQLAGALELRELLAHQLDEAIVLDIAGGCDDDGVRRVVRAHVRAQDRPA